MVILFKASFHNVSPISLVPVLLVD